MYRTITAKKHGANFISIKQLKGHPKYYIQLNNSYLHKTFITIEDAIKYVNQRMNLKEQHY